ncbi:MAG TPA: ROK family protein [Solirubrobacterales bacterium]|jgi:glucokinase|nr:ROK family protein [Solirubrobacterales bacterium]
MASGNDQLRGGIDLGGTKIQTAIVDADGKVLGEARRPTPTSGGPQDVAETMAAALSEAAQQAGVETAALEGVGVGSPGDADERTGVVSAARNLPGWEGSFPLGEKLKAALGTEVRVGNDVQVATEAEFHLGAGREFQSLIGVFWGTGVGGGLVLDGKPWLGRGAAGEIGHMVVKRGGAKCPCGRKGCMEAYAGRSAMEAEARRQHEEGKHTDLFKLMEKHEKPRLTSGIWERAIDHGDHLATKLIDRAIEALGTGVASAVNLLDPEAVILGGGLGVRFGERYMEALTKEMGKHLFLDEKPPAVRVVTLGDLGGAIGASLLFAR